MHKSKIRELLVPDSYKTSQGSLYKARALNYAVETSTIRPCDIIVHLDEETLLTESVLTGIKEFVAEDGDRIGQGIIVYGRGHIENMWTTLADSVRVADDWCRFRFFFSIGAPLQGMKGSFVICPSWIEKEVTFDFGPSGSITEDAVFAMEALYKKHKFGWVSGFMSEKSPFNFYDLARQRRRWVQGLWRSIFRTNIPWRFRIFLLTMVVVWNIAPVAMILNYSFGVLFVSGTVERPYMPFIASFQAVASAFSYFLYSFGAMYNFDMQKGWAHYILCVISAFIFLPFFWAFECFAIAYALSTWRSSSMSFEIVNKEFTGLNNTDCGDNSGASTPPDSQRPLLEEETTPSEATTIEMHIKPESHTSKDEALPLNAV